MWAAMLSGEEWLTDHFAVRHTKVKATDAVRVFPPDPQIAHSYSYPSAGACAVLILLAVVSMIRIVQYWRKSAATREIRDNLNEKDERSQIHQGLHHLVIFPGFRIDELTPCHVGRESRSQSAERL